MRDRIRQCGWLIAAVLLGLVVWHWPRGDSRFVGTWAITMDGDDAPSEATFTLHANGAGHLSYDDGARHFFGWRTAGGELIVGPGTRRFPSRPVQWLGMRIMDLTGHTFLLTDVEYDVLGIDRDRIAVRFDDEAWTLTRVGE